MSILVSYFFLSISHHLYLHAIGPCMTAHVRQEPAYTTSAVNHTGQIGYKIKNLRHYKIKNSEWNRVHKKLQVNIYKKSHLSLKTTLVLAPYLMQFIQIASCYHNPPVFFNLFIECSKDILLLQIAGKNWKIKIVTTTINYMRDLKETVSLKSSSNRWELKDK
jgi:hypothetical protein